MTRLARVRVGPSDLLRRAGRARIASFGLIAIASLGSIGCTTEPPPPRPNVIVLLADTLRADHTTIYGYERDTTPALARRATGGVVFERARSQAACTFPSVASLMTGLYPARFLGQGFQRHGIPERFDTLAEILQREGWSTIALSASTVVRDTPSDHNAVGGYGWGFDVFDEECADREAACLRERAVAHVDRTEGPFLLYVHYMDPHHPYRPPPDHPLRFAQGVPEIHWLRDGNPDPIERLVRGQGVEGENARRDHILHLRDLYDDEVHYLDGEVDRLLTELEIRGHLEDALVVLASDHGEAFLENGDDLKHCVGLWDSVTRVPLVMWPPSSAPGQRITAAVENADVVPTILDYSGIGRDDLDGESLRPLMEGAPPKTPALAFSAQTTLRSADDGRWKLLVDLDSGRRRLYDLAKDPTERIDVADRYPNRAARLDTALDAWLERNREARFDPTTIERSKRVEQSLRAMGYLQ